ncbi:MAG: hypothetical protein PHR06_01145 [Candidatus Cloacimonetes bacterium]|nr:hypothetical protein [Candidatus Cloacimonadota bacterium]
MNRAERRRQQSIKPDAVYNMKSSDVQQIKKSAVDEAVDKAFFLMLSIPVMILHDKYSLLMKKEVEGKPREERFADLCLDLYDSYVKGYVSFEDLEKCLWEEAGVKMQRSNT